MKPIPLKTIVAFNILVAFLVLFSGAGAWWLGNGYDLGKWELAAGISAFLMLFATSVISSYWISRRLLPIKEGYVRDGSRNQFAYHVYILYYLVFFYSLTRSNLLPTPLMRIVYQLLGCRLGSNTYPSGLIMDPPFTRIGANTIVGHGAIISAHNLVGNRIAHRRVVIGNNVTIGGNVVVCPGVIIGDNAVLCLGAVVLPNVWIAEGITIPPCTLVPAGKRICCQADVDALSGAGPAASASLECHPTALASLLTEGASA